MTNSKKIVSNGNRAVVINQQEDTVWANLYVNTRNGIENAEITTTRWTGKTVKGAEQWAKKILSK